MELVSSLNYSSIFISALETDIGDSPHEAKSWSFAEFRHGSIFGKSTYCEGGAYSPSLPSDIVPYSDTLTISKRKKKEIGTD